MQLWLSLFHFESYFRKLYIECDVWNDTQLNNTHSKTYVSDNGVVW